MYWYENEWHLTEVPCLPWGVKHLIGQAVNLSQGVDHQRCQTGGRDVHHRELNDSSKGEYDPDRQEDKKEWAHWSEVYAVVTDSNKI